MHMHMDMESSVQGRRKKKKDDYVDLIWLLHVSLDLIGPRWQWGHLSQPDILHLGRAYNTVIVFRPHLENGLDLPLVVGHGILIVHYSFFFQL